MTHSDWLRITAAFAVLALGWLVAALIALDSQRQTNENQERIERVVQQLEEEQHTIDVYTDRTGVLSCALAYADEPGEQALMDQYSVYGRLDPKAVAADWPECEPLFERLGVLPPP